MIAICYCVLEQDILFTLYLCVLYDYVSGVSLPQGSSGYRVYLFLPPAVCGYGAINIGQLQSALDNLKSAIYIYIASIFILSFLHYELYIK